jgi:hypothetical protein
MMRITLVALTIAVAHDEDTQLIAEAEHHEPVLRLRVLRVRNLERILVQEHTASLLEGHTVLATVRRRLSLVPLEPEVLHLDESVPTV